MVLQDYGAAIPMTAEEPARQAPKGSMSRKFVAVAAVCLGSLALVLLVGSSAQSGKGELLQTQLSQHLMSQFSVDDVEDSEGSGDEYGSNTMSLSDSSDSSNFYGSWGHASYHHSGHGKSANKWETQLQKLQAGEEARRKAEDQSYFSGVAKAFGKKAGEAMMAAFNGKTKNHVLSKIKLDEKKLKERKDALAQNTKLPSKAHKDDAQMKQINKAAKADAKKAASTKKEVEASVAKKQAEAKSAKKEEVKTEAKKKADAKKHGGAHSDAVKAALQVAKEMAAHKDPVAKTEKTKVAKKQHKADALKHTGVIGDGEKIKKLVHEFKHAHGKKKKALKARVQSLEQQIKDDFSKVTAFGHSAKTAFARAEAKEKQKQ